MASSGTVPGFLDTFPKQETTGYLLANKMPVMIFPLTRDYFYQYWLSGAKTVPQSVRTYEMTGVELGYKDLFLAPDPDNVGGWVRYTILYHTEGSQLLAVGVYDRGKKDLFGNYVPIISNYTEDKRTDFWTADTEHTALGNYYPNKIVNDLEVAQAILDYQAVNGPFVAGTEYSMLTIMNFKGRLGYTLGKTSSDSLVTGGGACLMSTNWMKMITLMGAKITQRWEHPPQMTYFENPYGGSLLGIDATDAMVEWPSYDLKWIQPTTGYVTITAAVMTDGTEVTSDYGDELDKFDATEFITMRFTTQQPDLSTEKIHNLQQAYLAYRGRHKPSTDSLNGVSKLVSQVYWVRGDKFSLLLQQIAPEERVGRFANEMQTDLLLKGVIGFRTDANAIDPHDQVLVGTFLKTKPWYTQEIAQLGSDSVQTNEFEAALRHLDWTSNKVSGQKIQCFGLVILVAGMDGRFPNVGGVSGNAAQLAPDSIKNGNDMVVSMGDYLAIQVKTLEDVRVGDLLVRYDSMVGHVAAVVGKKTVNGQTVLLIASANQARDGRVALFEVDDNNFEVTFGVSPFKKIVLRKS